MGNIWNLLMKEFNNAIGVAALMGNLQAESSLKANNLQNNGNTRLNLSDEEFTKKVNDGTYSRDNFIHDGYGYSLAQWTYWTRKRDYYDFMKNNNYAIGDETGSVLFLINELKAYVGVYNSIKNATDIRTASDIILKQFERPADQSENACVKRVGFGIEIYHKMVTEAPMPQAQPQTQPQGIVSPLIRQDLTTCNYTATRNHKIDTITPHCFVGEPDVTRAGNWCKDPSHKASANFTIAKNGEIVQNIPIDARSWCSSSAANDNRSITVECASLATAPYSFNDKVYKALVELTVYLMKKYNKNKLVAMKKGDEGEVSDNIMRLTQHNFYAAKECPGRWFISKINDGSFINDVNAYFTEDKQQATSQNSVLYKVQCGAFANKKNAENLVTQLKAKGFDCVIVEERRG